MIANIKSTISRLVREEEGATLVEYVLLVGLIGIVAAVAMTAMGNASSNSLNTAVNKIP